MKQHPRSFPNKLIPRSLWHLLLAAAVIHLVLVLTIHIVGKTQAWPSAFDARGVGVSFAIDSNSYRAEAETMARLLQQGQFREWWNFSSRYRSPSHILYSIPFALLGGLVGYGTLAAEPLNLCYYLAIVALTYGIGVEVFDRRVGTGAATIVALWPTLLLYSSQMLRDPLAIAAMLLLVLSLSICIKRSLSLVKGVAIGAAGSGAVLLLWLVRSDTWELVCLIIVLAAAAVVLSQVKQRRFAAGPTLGAIIILVFTFGLPRVLPMFRLEQLATPENAEVTQAVDSAVVPSMPIKSEAIAPWEKLSRQVGFLRHRFIARYPDAGSNIDTTVELRGTGDVIRYFPRAAEIGLLAPFPNMWFARGRETGLAGRLLTGGETLIMYFIIVLAAITLIHERRRLLVWFLLLASTAGCITFGYVVVNIAILHRIRYPFFILLIILGVRGGIVARNWISKGDGGNERGLELLQ